MTCRGSFALRIGERRAWNVIARENAVHVRLHLARVVEGALEIIEGGEAQALLRNLSGAGSRLRAVGELRGHLPCAVDIVDCVGTHEADDTPAKAARSGRQTLLAAELRHRLAHCTL